jgi:hypothetical protein
MNNCPRCMNKIPLRKYFFMSNLRNIRCPSCKTELLPNKMTLSIIGGISGFCGALTPGIASVIYYLTGQKYFIDYNHYNLVSF